MDHRSSFTRFVQALTAGRLRATLARTSLLLILLTAVLILGVASSFALTRAPQPVSQTATLSVCRSVQGHWRLMHLGVKSVRRTDAPTIGGRCPVAKRVIICHAAETLWLPWALPPAAAAAAVASGDRKPAWGTCPSGVPPERIAPPTTTAPVAPPPPPTTTTAPTTVAEPPPAAAAPAPPAPPATTTAVTTTTATTTTTSTTTTTATTTTTTTTTQAPVVAITQPLDTTFVGGTVTVTVSVTGGTAPYALTLSVDGAATSLVPTGSGSTYTFAWDTTTATEARHALTVDVTDATSAHATSAAVNVTVDRTPPLVSITAPTAGAFASGTLSASADASDLFGVASVQFAIDGTNVGAPVTTPVGQIYTAPALSLVGFANGAHALTAIATDNSGKVTTSTAVSFNIGIGPLAASITSPLDLHFATGVTTISVSVTGGVGPYSLQLLVDGAPSGSPTSSTTLSWPTAGLSETLHALAVQVTDAQATIAVTPTIHETVDNTPPTVLSLAPPNNDRDNGPTLFKVDASDAHGVASVQFTVDGTAVGPLVTTPDAGSTAFYSTTFDTSTLAAGTHVVSAVVTDNAGHTATAPSVTIKTGTITYLPVLNYHGIDASPPDMYELTPATADAELAYLAANNYHSVTLEQYQQWLSGADIGVVNPVLITVDDGISDQLAWDALLQKYNFKAVMFVVTGFADNTTPGDTGSQNLTWSQLQTLAGDGRWEMAFHAGALGHGDAYATGQKANGFGYSAACEYFYSCLGTGETVAQFEAAVAAEISAGVAELKSNIPSASTVAWAAPFNDAGQWTNLYNDPTVQAWLPGFLASQFPITFMQTSPITYAGAAGLVGSLTGFGREYRFEVHDTTTSAEFAAALTDPAFER